MNELDAETIKREGFDPLELWVWRQSPNGWSYEDSRRWTFQIANEIRQRIMQSIYEHAEEFNKA